MGGKRLTQGGRGDGRGGAVGKREKGCGGRGRAESSASSLVLL